MNRGQKNGNKKRAKAQNSKQIYISRLVVVVVKRLKVVAEKVGHNHRKRRAVYHNSNAPLVHLVTQNIGPVGGVNV